MFKSYLKSTLRKLIKDRLYTVINVVGLSTGFAMFLVITLYIEREQSTDKQYEGYEEIYRVDTDYTNDEGLDTRYAASYQPLAQTLKSDIPDVAQSVMFFSPAAQFSFRSGDQVLSVENHKIFFTTDDFFEVFSHQWQREGKMLSKPNTVVISGQLAQRFFNNADPIGKSLSYENQGQHYNLEVTGVFNRADQPSHLDYDMLINYDSDINFWKRGIDNNWRLMFVYTYFKVNENSQVADWNKELALIRKKYKPESEVTEFAARPLSEIYWAPSEVEPGSNGNKAYIYVFGAFGLTVVLLAVVNFVNLMTARSIRRSKEVAVRKMIGASRMGLVGQFLTESTMLSITAMLFGGVLAERMIGPINANLDLSLSFNVFGNGLLLLMVVAMPFLVGLLSGLYPAFVLSAFKPINLLGGRFKWNVSHNYLRNGLLALQFLISVLVISGVLVISRQMEYIKTQGLGFQADPIVVLPRISNDANYLMRQSVASNPNVKGIASLSSIPGYRNPRNRNIKESGTTGNGVVSNGIWVSEDYAEIIDLNFNAGRNFTPEDREQTVILNERAVNDLGWDSLSAIGKQLVMTGRDGFEATAYEVIGVIEDYHYQSMYENVAPLFLMNNSQSRTGGDASIVQISQEQFDETIDYLSQAWVEVEQSEAFDYYFLDDALNEVYKKEVRLSKTVDYVSGVAILISLLGLFGLVSLSLQSKKKEIGIRKVMGATVAHIAGLFAKNYLWVIGLSVLVGLPISYYLLELWLANFAYGVGYSYSLYFMVGMGLMVVSLGLVGLQSATVSRSNPVNSLRDE